MRGTEGMLRVRCSSGTSRNIGSCTRCLAIDVLFGLLMTGLRAVDYYGALMSTNTSDVELGGWFFSH